jgi:protein TonB
MSVFILASVILHLLVLFTCAHLTRTTTCSSIVGAEVIEIDLMTLPGIRKSAPEPVAPLDTVPGETPAAPEKVAEIQDPDIATPAQTPPIPGSSIPTEAPKEEPPPTPVSCIPKEETIPSAAPATDAITVAGVQTPPATIISESGDSSPEAGTRTSAATASHEDTTTTATTGSVIGSGSGASPGQYVKENFYYIKDLITRNLSYPVVARRMKWQGTVVVSFVVCEDGMVKGTTVVTSSGHSVLDKNALTTIKALQPFPAPPAEAEFNMPIKYTLKNQCQ